MQETNQTCPVCGSTSVQIMDHGTVCCKSCGYGTRKRPYTQHECPLCRSKRVYYRPKVGMYACRRCGLGQKSGIKLAYLQDVAARVTAEQKGGNLVKTCPICGEGIICRLLDESFTCTRCGFSSSKPSGLYPSYLGSLPPFREITCGAVTHDHAPLTINGRTFALRREGGTIWLVVGGAFPAFVGPGPHQIPVYGDDSVYAELDFDDPIIVARAWRLVLFRAAMGQDSFARDLERKYYGLTLTQAQSLQVSELLSPKFYDTMRIAAPTLSADYAIRLFEIGLLNGVATELEAVKPFLYGGPAAAQDDDGISASNDKKRYYPISVPEDLPPVDEVTLRFGGERSAWVFVASHIQPGGRP